MTDFNVYAIDMIKSGKEVSFIKTKGGCLSVFSCKELGLECDVNIRHAEGGTFIRGRLENKAGGDRAVSLIFSLPIAGSDLTWHDDIRRSRKIKGSKCFENTEKAECGSGAISVYPVGTVSGKTAAGTAFCKSIGLDPTRPAPFRISYNAKKSALEIRYDFAIVPDTAKFPDSAEFCFVVFDSDTEWGFRGAFERYMKLFPAQFAVRAVAQGLWMPFTDIEKVENFQDFGFRFHEIHGTGSDFDSNNSIDAFNYTEPFTWWMEMPPEMERTYDNAVAMVDSLASGGYPLKKDSTVCYANAREEYKLRAAALKQSGMKNADGKYFVQFYDLPWCNGACWIMNPNPDQPGEVNGATINWSPKHNSDRHGFSRQLSGEYIDSVEGYTTPELNYDRGAFPYETLPLAFDAKTKQPGIFKGISVFEFTRKIGADMHSQNKMLFGNGVPYRFSWLLANFDIMGTETVWLSEDKKSYAPIKDEQMALWRTLSGRKPYLLLQNTDFSCFDHSMVERYMQRVLFYGLFPSMFSVDAASHPYWENPALYNRDRDLFKRYVPLVKEVSEAGWEPVTLAKSSNKKVFTERYGTRYLTLCNDTLQPQKTRITINFHVGRSATERISGKKISINSRGSFQIELAPQSSALIDFD